jgi:hypothetical protein
MGMRTISASSYSEEKVMSTKSKFAAALAVLTLATTAALPVSQAEARHRGWGFGAAVLGSAIVAGAIANSAYAAYDEPYGYRRCSYEPVYDNAGFYIRTARVCRYE